MKYFVIAILSVAGSIASAKEPQKSPSRRGPASVAATPAQTYVLAPGQSAVYCSPTSINSVLNSQVFNKAILTAYAENNLSWTIARLEIRIATPFSVSAPAFDKNSGAVCATITKE